MDVTARSSAGSQDAQASRMPHAEDRASPSAVRAQDGGCSVQWEDAGRDRTKGERAGVVVSAARG